MRVFLLLVAYFLLYYCTNGCGSNFDIDKENTDVIDTFDRAGQDRNKERVYKNTDDITNLEDNDQPWSNVRTTEEGDVDDNDEANDRKFPQEEGEEEERDNNNGLHTLHETNSIKVNSAVNNQLGDQSQQIGIGSEYGTNGNHDGINGNHDIMHVQSSRDYHDVEKGDGNGEHMSLQTDYHMLPVYFDSTNPNRFYWETNHDYGNNNYYYSSVIAPPGHGISRYTIYIVTFHSLSNIGTGDELKIKSGNGYTFKTYGYGHPSDTTITASYGIKAEFTSNWVYQDWGFRMYVTMQDPKLWENAISSYPNIQQTEVYTRHNYWNSISFYSETLYHSRLGLSSDEISQYTVTFNYQSALGTGDYMYIKDASNNILYTFSGSYDSSFTHPRPGTYTSIPKVLSLNSANGLKFTMESDSSGSAWGFYALVEMSVNPRVWMDREDNNQLKNCPNGAWNETAYTYKCKCLEAGMIHDTGRNECIQSLFHGLSTTYFPYAFYQAEDYDDVNNEWPDAFGSNKFPTVTANSITKGTEFNTHGAKGNVTFVSGGVTDKLDFPSGSSSYFTYCTISRYVGNANNDRVFTAGTSSCSYQSYWYHGHSGGLRGVARYGNSYNTAYQDVSADADSDDWLVMCGTTYSSVSNPYAVVADGKYISTYNYGYTCNLGVNTNSDSSRNSDWAVAAVLIYDYLITEYMYSKNNYLAALESRLRSSFLDNTCHGGNQFRSSKLILSKGRATGQILVDLGQTMIDDMFKAAGAVFRRDCRDCDATHKTIYYKRLTEFPTGFSMYSNIKNTWSSANNVLNQDFKLYSTWGDLLNDTNAWNYCQYDNYGYGFPYNCAPDVSSCCTGQYNSEVYSGQVTYDYYVLRQSASGLEEIEGCSVCPEDSYVDASRSLSRIISTCTCNTVNYIVTYNATNRTHVCMPYDAAFNISGTAPIGIWRAQDYDADSSIIAEASGRYMKDTQMLSATYVQMDTTGTYGVGGSSSGVLTVKGDYYTQLLTPEETSVYWTICSLTRTGYSSGGYVLTSLSGDWAHGHSSNYGYRGYYMYGNTNYNTVYMGTIGHYLVQCAQNSDDAPKNIITHGVPMGGKAYQFNAGSSKSLQLCMGFYSSRSYEVGFSELIIWDRWITQQEMESVSNVLLSRICGDGYYWSIMSNGCTICPAGSVSSGSTCKCPSNTFWDIEKTGTCTSCPTNSSSTAGSMVCTCNNSTEIISGGKCVSYYTDAITDAASIEPWGVYRAENWREGTQRIVEARGRKDRDATAHSIPDGSQSVSMDLFRTSQTGNGVIDSKSIYEISNYGQLYGQQGSWYNREGRIIFPKMPGNEFTYCSITRRYTGSSYVLSSAEPSCAAAFGHYSSYRGVVYYGGTYFTPYTQYGTGSDWAVVCGRNLASSTSPTYTYNVVLNSIPIGQSTLGYSAQQCQMGFNYMSSSQYYWGFSELIMWDHHLSDADMVAVNTAMYHRLAYQRQFNVTEFQNGDYPHSPRVEEEYVCDRVFEPSTMGFGRCYRREDNPGFEEVL